MVARRGSDGLRLRVELGGPGAGRGSGLGGSEGTGEARQEQEGHSLDEQARRIREYTERHALVLDEGSQRIIGALC
jgi:hypothetical protein